MTQTSLDSCVLTFFPALPPHQDLVRVGSLATSAYTVMRTLGGKYFLTSEVKVPLSRIKLANDLAVPLPSLLPFTDEQLLPNTITWLQTAMRAHGSLKKGTTIKSINACHLGGVGHETAGGMSMKAHTLNAINLHQLRIQIIAIPKSTGTQHTGTQYARRGGLTT